MPVGKYRDLNYCIWEYKEATGVKKDKIFYYIIEHLSNHINAVINLLKERNIKVKPKVQRMVYKSMQSTMKGVPNDNFQATLAGLAKDIDEDDIRQQVYLTILQLIKSYKSTERTFLEFFTFIMPRRIMSWLYRNSKDASSQFTTKSFPSMIDESEDSENWFTPFIEDAEELSEIMMSDIIDNEEEKEFFADYLAGLSNKKLMEKYHFLSEDEIHEHADTILVYYANCLNHKKETTGRY
jgi:hypothetical protein